MYGLKYKCWCHQHIIYTIEIMRIDQLFRERWYMEVEHALEFVLYKHRINTEVLED